jgi:hypothetical protein
VRDACNRISTAKAHFGQRNAMFVPGGAGRYHPAMYLARGILAALDLLPARQARTNFNYQQIAPVPHAGLFPCAAARGKVEQRWSLARPNCPQFIFEQGQLRPALTC